MRTLNAVAVVALATTTFGCANDQPNVECEEDGICTDESDDKADFGGGKAVTLDQGWSTEERKAWRKGTFGGGLLPSDWFRALENPAGPGSLIDAIKGAGFVSSPDSDFGIIGLVETDTPRGKAAVHNCAFCHTAEVRYQGKRMRIDGAGALGDIATYTNLTIGAVLATSLDPARFDRYPSESVRAHEIEGARRGLGGHVATRLA